MNASTLKKYAPLILLTFAALLAISFALSPKPLGLRNLRHSAITFGVAALCMAGAFGLRKLRNDGRERTARIIQGLVLAFAIPPMLSLVLWKINGPIVQALLALALLSLLSALPVAMWRRGQSSG